MRTLALHGSITLLIVALALLIYDHWVVRPALAIGMVDVGYVYRVKEAEFTQLLTKSDSGEDRQRAMDMARRFSQRLPAALEELPQECRCLVVVKSAMVGRPGQAFDLTPALIRKVDQP